VSDLRAISFLVLGIVILASLIRIDRLPSDPPQQKVAEATQDSLELYLPKPGDGAFTRCAKLKVIQAVKDPMTPSRARDSGSNYQSYVKMFAVRECQHLDD
jgi:hypothetical protein